MSASSQFLEQFKDIIVDESFKQITQYLSSSPVFVKNEEGKFIYANALFLDHCRVDTLEDILGKDDYDFFPSELAELYVQDDQEVLTQARPLFNRLETVPDNQGIPHWQVTHKLPLYDHEYNVCGILGTFEEPLKSTRTFPKMDALLPAIRYVDTHYGDNVMVADLAAQCSMSVRSFYRLFKDTFAITPQQYLQKHRIIQACHLILAGQLNLSDIAQRCGFYDHSHFTREFRKHMRENPSSYLKRMRNRHA